MRSATPKLLHPVCGRPIIAWPVAAARDAGAGKVVVVDGPERRLRSVLGDQVCFAVQEQPRGTADAVKSACPELGSADTVVVMNGDHPLISAETIRGLAETHAQSRAAVTVATAVLNDPTGYGRVVRGSDGGVERVVETKAPGDASDEELRIREINTGIYAFDREALLSALEEVGTDNAQGELYLPDVLMILRGRGRPVLAHEIADSSELGVNDRLGLAAVTQIAQGRIHERHMRAGVTIVNPACTLIDADVQIAPDATIAPFSSLHGATVIGARSTIGPLSTLIDARVGDESRVVHSYVVGAEVGDRVSVGPFCYLRPGTILREGSKAGTFVEIKNSDVAPGAKVPHLSYIGDTDIGEKANIGAGTITANYDGSNKHRTQIGAAAFVGVDTMFVAPVSVGEEGYTAAGSVITEDVPPGSLGIARARQENIEGYRERRKEREAAQADPRKVRESSERQQSSNGEDSPRSHPTGHVDVSHSTSSG
jgi:bifunctional UDP-N-acetylglucosamine pyrophosphorylase/glucosamine-1-phosphate N-acetyltransferase